MKVRCHVVEFIVRLQKMCKNIIDSCTVFLLFIGLGGKVWKHDSSNSLH